MAQITNEQIIEHIHRLAFSFDHQRGVVLRFHNVLDALVGFLADQDLIPG